MNKILIVDDNPEICRLLRRVAEGMGYETYILDNPRDFESAFSAINPDLVVLDLQMPNVDGIELLRHLASIRSRVSIVVVSGVQTRILETAERLACSLGLNIAGSVHKPICLEEFERHLQRHYFVANSAVTAGRSISESDLAQAIRNGEIVVHYQPIVCLKSGRINGVEALARWEHPVHGLIGPNDFIPLAEDSGLISLLTYRVISQAATEMAPVKAGNQPMQVAINLSAHMLDDLELPERIDGILESAGFSHDRLTLEITESTAMDDPSQSMDILIRLRLKGANLSIDDFGSGHSSLIQLYRLPYSEVKIDQSFVQEVLSNDEAAVIVRSVVNLGKNLNLRVVAEGIEDQASLDYLNEIGCDVGQGFLFCKPLAFDELSAWLGHCDRGFLGSASARFDDLEPATELRTG